MTSSEALLRTPVSKLNLSLIIICPVSTTFRKIIKLPPAHSPAGPRRALRRLAGLFLLSWGLSCWPFLAAAEPSLPPVTSAHETIRRDQLAAAPKYAAYYGTRITVTQEQPKMISLSSGHTVGVLVYDITEKKSAKMAIFQINSLVLRYFAGQEYLTHRALINLIGKDQILLDTAVRQGRSYRFVLENRYQKIKIDNVNWRDYGPYSLDIITY